MGVYNEKVVCHTGVIHFPLKKGWKRIHRLVVLPDYQGIGIGTHFINEIAGVYKDEGFKVSLITTTPALTHSLKRSENWILTRRGRSTSQYKGLERKNRNSKRYRGEKKLSESASGKRVTYSFLYKD